MGGRGTSITLFQVTSAPQPTAQERGYEVLSRQDFGNQATYAIIERTGRNWTLLTRDAASDTPYLPEHTFAQDTPTLRWVNGERVMDVFVDGMDTDTFLKHSGLELSLKKGGFVLSKRLSRIFRPQYVAGFFPKNDLKITYLDLDDDGTKVFDGAGIVSRNMLQRMIEQLPDVSPRKRHELLQELEHTQRVEFTLVTERGQDKGHAIVSDTIDQDFLLPHDTKGEVKLTDGNTFVGFNFVHKHDHMRLDIQSLINLYPFFDEHKLEKWLKDEGELFMASIQSGDVNRLMQRIDPFTTLEEVQDWGIREFLASGGHPLWFHTPTKTLINQHLRRLNASMLDNMRLPIPGGRYYVMPARVGNTAGMAISVERGEVFIDKNSATAWVNDDDWLQLDDAQAGIRDILGGADNDDALWLHPFTDEADGERKVLAWRSPNQVGEYVLLKPTVDSKHLLWQTRDDEEAYPPADSRQLITRTDKMPEIQYLNLVDPATAGGLGEGNAYTVNIMSATISRANANRGGLGAYCNQLMVAKAVSGGLPQNPPAPLEQVIDASVKTGEDLSPVLNWSQQRARAIRASGVPVSRLLHRRLGKPREDGRDIATPTTNHWLDRIENTVKTHISHIEQQRDDLLETLQLPDAVYAPLFERPDMLDAGSVLNKIYRTAVRPKQGGDATPEDFARARQAVQDFVGKYAPQERELVLLGSLVSATMMGKSDTAAWLDGEQDGKRTKGLAHDTMNALRGLGLLDEVQSIDGRVVTYPRASIYENSYQTVSIPDAWRGFVDEKDTDPKTQKRRAAMTVRALVKQDFSVTVQVEDDQQVAYLGARRLGSIQSTTPLHDGQRLHVKLALAHNGQIKAVVG